MGAKVVHEALLGLTVLEIQKTPRSSELRQKRAFYGGTQHDHLNANWDGGSRSPGVGYMQERLRTQGFVPINDVDGGVSSWLRRPNCPVPVGRQIVNGFTGMLLTEEPKIHIYGDDDTQSLLRAVFQKAKLWEVFAQARNLAGAQGCAAILSGLHRNEPYAELLNPTDLWVVEWDDQCTGWRPKIVVEQVRVEREVRDAETGKLKVDDYWRTRAWTDKETVTYKDELCEKYKDGAALTVSDVIPHKAGRCPVSWYQNFLDMTCPYSLPDYDAVYELMDQMDRLESQVHKAAHANTDPSLLLKQDRVRDRNKVIRRGGVVQVSSDGDARYLEISGSGIEVSQKQIDRELAVIRDTVQCVLLSPSEGHKMQSSESMQLLYRPMEIRASRFRPSLSAAVEDVCELWVGMAEAYGVKIDSLGAKNDSKSIGEGILLPPRKTTDSGEDESTEPHKLGTGGSFSIAWAPSFKPTAAQISAMSAGLSTATGAKAYLSTHTATRLMSAYLTVDGEEEVSRLDEQQDEEEAYLEEQLQVSMAHAEAQRAHAPDDDDDDLSIPSNQPGSPPGAGDKTPDEILKPAASAKSGKRGPAKED